MYTSIDFFLGVHVPRFFCGITCISGPGARFSKAPETFRARKAILVTCILKTEKCIGLKLCMKETSVHIKNIMESDSSVIIRFAILLCLSGCENFSGPSRNGPLGPFANLGIICSPGVNCGPVTQNKEAKIV